MSVVSSNHGKTWVFQVTALCIVLGMLLALSLKTQRQVLDEGLPARLPALKAEFRALKQDNEALQKEVAEYKSRLDALALQEASGQGAGAYQRTLNQARLLAGTIPAEGPGIVVTLHDSPKLDPAETRQEVIEWYLVHDKDIRAVVDELFAAGAEAISVNDQRLIANSSIRCVGPVVLVNSVQLAPPYTIRAIGAPDVLEKALNLQGGIADELFLFDMIEVKKEKHIVAPAYTGSTRFNVAKPVQETKKEEGPKKSR